MRDPSLLTESRYWQRWFGCRSLQLRCFRTRARLGTDTCASTKIVRSFELAIHMWVQGWCSLREARLLHISPSLVTYLPTCRPADKSMWPCRPVLVDMLRKSREGSRQPALNCAFYARQNQQSSNLEHVTACNGWFLAGLAGLSKPGFSVGSQQQGECSLPSQPPDPLLCVLW